MYFAGPMPTTKYGKRYILIAMEHLTGWPNAGAARSQTSGVAIKFLEREVRAKFDPLTVVDYDNGPAFTYVP